MSLLSSNRHRDLPQRLFEIADVMLGDHNMAVICGVSEDNRSSFTEVKGYIQRLLGDLGIAFILEPSDLGQYIKGRSAAIMIEVPGDGMEGWNGPFPELERGRMMPLGHFGEVHPRIIEKNELSSPVSGFELDLDLILQLTNI